jgi:hypothetical protein
VFFIELGILNLPLMTRPKALLRGNCADERNVKAKPRKDGDGL